jgi:hypothetical protein
MIIWIALIINKSKTLEEMETEKQLTQKIKFAIKQTLPLKQAINDPEANLLTTGNILGFKYKTHIWNDEDGEEIYSVKFKDIDGKVYFKYHYQLQQYLSDLEFQQCISDIKNEIKKIS